MIDFNEINTLNVEKINLPKKGKLNIYIVLLIYLLIIGLISNVYFLIKLIGLIF